jgi:outer membrane lipoprotein-sorting protein
MAAEVKPLIHPFIRRFLIVLMLLTTASAAFSQETATRFFERVSERYGLINDYTADLVITRGDEVQRATVWYKKPNLLRLDFVVPDGMVMAVDGETFQVWVPEYSVTFSQTLRKDGQAPMASLVSPGGLELISKYFTVSYDPSPVQVPLDPGSSELVTKLKADWKSNNEGFRKLELSIDSDLRIRRITGITTNGERIVFSFSRMEINRGIPDNRFQYKSPPTGNTIENFLFDPEN